jgi:hypothetical protein
MDFIRFNARKIFDLTILFYTMPVTEKKRKRGGEKTRRRAAGFLPVPRRNRRAAAASRSASAGRDYARARRGFRAVFHP